MVHRKRLQSAKAVGSNPTRPSRMLMMRKALYESVYDTSIAALINFPLGYILTKLSIEFFHMESFGVSLVNFFVMTSVAVTRKTMVRMKFAKIELS